MASAPASSVTGATGAASLDLVVDLLMIIIAIGLPPVAVYLKRGCGGHLAISILLCLLGWIWSIIHAIIIVLRPSPFNKDLHRTLFSVPSITTEGRAVGQPQEQGIQNATDNALDEDGVVPLAPERIKPTRPMA